MRILLTGAGGSVGSHHISYILSRTCHTILATDLTPLPLSLSLSLSKDNPRIEYRQCDLTSISSVEDLFNARPQVDAVIHTAGIPSPKEDDFRLVHYTNVTSNYNILYTAAEKGVRRIVQMSSCNAIGMSFTPDERRWIEKIPIDEQVTPRPEDAYSLSKLICETQASAISRAYPNIQIASLRLHRVRDNLHDATIESNHVNYYCWVSQDAVASASILALENKGGWKGHEVFFIVASGISYVKGQGRESHIDVRRETSQREGLGNVGECRGNDQVGIVREGEEEEEVGTMELMNYWYKGKIGFVDEDWFRENKRRSVFDCSKAETILGWKHDQS